MVIDYQRPHPINQSSFTVGQPPHKPPCFVVFVLLSVNCQELACLGTSQVLTDWLCLGWVGISQAWFWAIALHSMIPFYLFKNDIVLERTHTHIQSNEPLLNYLMTFFFFFICNMKCSTVNYWHMVHELLLLFEIKHIKLNWD